jgi:hypothetical protein
MVEEGGMDLESGNIREDIGEVSEADIARAQESLKKAKKVKAQIQQLQQQNAGYAWMLTMILKYVEHEEVLQQVSSQLASISVPAVFGQLVPFITRREDLSAYYQEHHEVASLAEQYDQTRTGLVSYLQNIRDIYLEITNEPLSQSVRFVAAYAEMEGLIDRSEWDEEKSQEFLGSLEQQL